MYRVNITGNPRINNQNYQESAMRPPFEKYFSWIIFSVFTWKYATYQTWKFENGDVLLTYNVLCIVSKKATDEASYQTLNYANMDMINEIFVQYVYTLMVPQLQRFAAILLYFVSKIWRWLHCKSDSYEVHKT